MLKGVVGVGLCQPKTPENIGAALRAATCFEVDIFAISGSRCVRNKLDTTKAFRKIPVIRINYILEAIPFDCIPIAVEICEKAESIINFKHPKNAFYIFGPEDGSVPSRIIDKCKHVIQIPTKYCLNLGVSVNLVLYDRLINK